MDEKLKKIEPVKTVYVIYHCCGDIVITAVLAVLVWTLLWSSAWLRTSIDLMRTEMKYLNETDRIFELETRIHDMLYHGEKEE